MFQKANLESAASGSNFCSTSIASGAVGRLETVYSARENVHRLPANTAPIPIKDLSIQGVGVRGFPEAAPAEGPLYLLPQVLRVDESQPSPRSSEASQTCRLCLRICSPVVYDDLGVGHFEKHVSRLLSQRRASQERHGWPPCRSRWASVSRVKPRVICSRRRSCSVPLAFLSPPSTWNHVLITWRIQTGTISS